MEKIHDNSNCPACSAKLSGTEKHCPFCGYRLVFDINPDSSEKDIEAVKDEITAQNTEDQILSLIHI